MAEQGYVLDIDTKFIQRLEQADVALEKMVKSVDNVANSLNRLASGSLARFASFVDSITGSVTNLSEAKIGDLGMNKTSQDAVDVIDKINDIGIAIDKILVDNKAYTNGALTKVNQEIDESVAKLAKLQELLDFYTKGEGVDAIGFADFSSLTEEANALVDRIELLEAEREAIKETAAAKIKAQLEALAAQREIDKEWAPIFKEREERERNQAAKAEKDAQIAAKRAAANEAAETRAAEANKKKAQSVIDNYNKEVNAARKAHEEQRKMYERLWKETEHRERTTYGGAMSFSQGTTSINQQIQAIKYLKEARLNLSKTSFGSEDEYKKAVKNITTEIKRQQAEIDELVDKNDTLKDSHNELIAVLSTVFSVQAIRGYVNQVAAVRGEFELQQRSLQALLQNKKEANELWQQTVNLAVKSPLQVKQLITATKQLAAYRVESQKLHQTTRMLADISQGLGVDMDRLILAFGQVKAANFLRGTELRQFSEAGINILDELANYYTAIEGKTITVSQVFERVSKRMVSFEDVERVLQRVTSAGGMFYKMQEIQSETLKGQMSNLRDQIDLMLNDIGESNEGIMKTGVQLAAWLIKNYKAFVPLLSAVTVAFTAMQLSMIKAKLGAEALSAGMASLRAVLISPWTYILTALAVVISEFASYKHEMNQIETTHKRFKESLIEMQAEMNDAMNVEKIENAREALTRLLEAAQKDFGVDFGLSPEDIQKMDLSALKDKFAEIRQSLFDADVIAQQLSESFAKDKKLESTFVRFGKAFYTFGISGKGGESMKTDFNDLQESANDLMSLLQRLGLEMAANEDIQLPAEHPLRMLKDAKESDLVYLERLISAFKEIRGKAVSAKIDVSGIDKALRVFDKAYEEAAREGDKFLNKSVENLASYAPEVIKASINQFIDDNEWDDFSRELMLRLRGQSLEVSDSADANQDGDLTEDENIEKTDSRYQNLMRTIKEMNSAYKELVKTFDDVTAKEGTMAKYAEALDDVLAQITINGEKISSAKFMELFDVTTEDGMLAALDKIAEDAPQMADKLKAKLEKGEIVWEAKVKVKEDADKDLINWMEDLFSGYELSLELDKLNMPSDMARQFFNVEAFSIDDIRAKLAAMEHKFVGTEMEDEYAKALRRIDEMEEKAQQERLKTYLAYARDSIGERAKIKLEELRKLNEIEMTFGEDNPELKQAASAKVQEDSYQAAKKLDWEDFQKSDTFISLFKDLDSASTLLTEHMIQKLEDFKNEWRDMPLEDMRIMVDKINQLRTHLVEQDPFNMGAQLLSKVRADGRSDAQIQEENIAEEQKIDAYNVEIAQLETILRLKEEGKAVQALEYAGSQDMAEMSALTVNELRKEVDQRKKSKKESEKTVEVNNQALQDQRDLRAAYAAQANYLQEGQKMANDLYDSFAELVDVLGAGDSPGAVFAQMGMDMANSVINCFALQLQLKSATVEAHTFGAAMNTAMSIVGWIVMGVQLIGQVLGAIFDAHDKKLQKQIDKAQEDIDRLTKEYEKLEKAIDKAFSADRINDYSRAASNNIDQQIKDYERMIALEEDKKKTDNNQIDDWKDTIEELREQQREMWEETNSVITGGVLDNVRDVARNFVDAWYEAFQETGDGLSGLEDDFNDMLSEIVKQQAALHIVGSYTDMYKDWLKEYVDAEHGDVALSAEEARAWAERVQQTFPELSTLLENFFTGTQDLMQSESEISGLSKGIQGVTETTAQVLEALLNSMRFYVADSNTQLKSIAAAFASGDVEQNPLLNELRQQTALIRSIESMFDSVIGRGGSGHSGAYLKVMV